MDPSEEIPRRSNLWLADRPENEFSGLLFDQITTIFVIALATFSFIVFWPLISKIVFEEAFFTPLTPFLIGLLSIIGLEANDTIRVLFIVSLMVSTVGIYLFVKELSKRQVTAILAAVIYLIPPVPIFVLTLIRRGLLEVELASARSFFTIVYGDGAHFLGLALIPFAAIFFLRYLKMAARSDLLATTVISALILLANRSQALNLLLIFTGLAITEFFLGVARVKIRRFLLVLLFTLGLVSFWYTFSFWAETLEIFNKEVVGNWRSLFPFPLIFTTLALFFSFVFFAKRQDRQPIFISFLLFVVFLVIIADWLLNQRSFLPHPQRLLPTLIMFASMVSALTLTAVVDKLLVSFRFNPGSWSLSARSLAALVFGFLSFLIFAAGAFFLSPLVILAVTGPFGIWSKIRLSVLADREQTLRMAGENFKLVKHDVGDWQSVFGVLVSLIFLGILLFWVFQRVLLEEKESAD